MTALSQEWRANTSSVPLVELANGLKGLTKVIGSISKDCEMVQFGPVGSETHNSRDIHKQTGEQKNKRIRIDADWAVKAGKYPIPHENYDVLVGLAVHEAGHSKVNSHDNTLPTAPTHKDLPIAVFHNIAEEIYVDTYMRAKYPVHAQYIDIARQAYRSPPDKIDWSSIAQVMTAKHVYGGSLDQTQIPQEHNVIHAIIIGMVQKLQKRPEDKSRSIRAVLYQNTYKAIVRLLESSSITQTIGPTQDDQTGEQLEQTQVSIGLDGKVTQEPPDSVKELLREPSAQSGMDVENKEETNLDNLNTPRDTDQPAEPKESDSPEPSDMGDGDFHNYTPVAEELSEAIEEAIETQLTDLTDKVKEILDESQQPADFAKMRGSNASVLHQRSKASPNKRKPDDKLRRDLDWIKRVQNTMDSVTYRGLPEGRLNRRALHRHYTDDRPYKQTKITQNQKTELVLLLGRQRQYE